MNKFSIGIIIVFLLSLSTSSYGQVWKPYFDSASSASTQNKLANSIELYIKAKQALPTDSAMSVTYAGICDSLAVIYTESDSFQLAEQYFTEAQKIQESILGMKNLDYLFSCSNLGILYRKMDLFDKSLPLLITVRDKLKKLTGKESLLYANACYHLGKLYTALENYELAKKLISEGKQIQHIKAGAVSKEYALSCAGLGNVYLELKQYQIAETLHLEAKDAWLKLYGNKHPGYGTRCVELGYVYEQMGQNEKAESMYIEARDLHEVNPGKLSFEYSNSLNYLGNFYHLQKKYKKAESIYLEVKRIRESIFGKFSKKYADICQNLGRVYYFTSQTLKALAQYQEVKEVRGKISGTNNKMYGYACNDLGTIFLLLGQFDKSELLYAESREVFLKLLGKKEDYAKACNSLAMVYTTQRKFDKAEPMIMEAFRIREKIFGKENFDYGNSCYSISVMYFNIGQYKKAEGYGIEAKRLYAKLTGNSNAVANYPNVLINLANIYKRMAMYDLAEPLYTEAKAIQDQDKLVNPLYIATLCNEFADLYRLTGAFEKAEPLLLRAKPIYGLMGKQHPDYMICLDNLGALYLVMGQYEKAEQYFNESRQLREKLYGKKNNNYIVSCSNLMTLYQIWGKPEKAIALIEDSRIEDKKDPNYIISTRNLAKLYKDLHQYDKAEELLLEILALQKQEGLVTGLDYAATLNSLASVYFYTARYKEAEPLFLEAKQLYRELMGLQNNEYGAFCTNLGGLYWALQQPEKAEEQFKESFEVKENTLRSLFEFTSEKEKAAFIKNISGEDNDIYSFYLSNNYSSDQPYSLSLFHRNLILSSSQSMRKEIFATRDSMVISKYTEWTQLKKYIALLYTKSTEERKKEVGEVEQKADGLEKELARLSVQFKTKSQKPGWKDISNALKKNEAAIEFISFDYDSTFGPRGDSNLKYYAAILLREGMRYPKMIALFKEQQLDSLLMQGKEKTSNNAVKNLYASRGVIVKGRQAETRSVYDLVWQPLESALNGIQTIYYSPSGMLHRIAFAALPVDSFTVLSDRYNLVQLASTGSLPSQQAVVINKADTIQLYGGIQYDADTSLLKETIHADETTGINGSNALPLGTVRDASFQYLPGTFKEIEDIRVESERFGIAVNVLSGNGATEKSFKQLESGLSPSILHIATHGFFFPDPEHEKKEKKDSLRNDTSSNAVVFSHSENPLFRSGLLFAGANNAWQGKPATGSEDGVLTAYEVSNMYLPNTKLVVLSACETALGDIKGNEGVYGLQRAFKIAGVQNLIMSLWKVPDAETAEFMELLYKNIFSGKSIAVAFQQTQSGMKNKYRKEPYKWAAWVLIQ